MLPQTITVRELRLNRDVIPLVWCWQYPKPQSDTHVKAFTNVNLIMEPEAWKGSPIGAVGSYSEMYIETVGIQPK